MTVRFCVLSDSWTFVNKKFDLLISRNCKASGQPSFAVRLFLKLLFKVFSVVPLTVLVDLENHLSLVFGACSQLSSKVSCLMALAPQIEHGSLQGPVMLLFWIALPGGRSVENEPRHSEMFFVHFETERLVDRYISLHSKAFVLVQLHKH